MVHRKSLLALFSGLLIIFSPLSIANNSIFLNNAYAAPSCADKGAQIGPQATRYNPITNLSLLRGTPPAGTSYACAYFGGGGYAFYDASDRYLGSELGGPLQNQTVCDAQNNCKPKPASCASTWDKMTNPGECLVRAAFAATGSLLMWFGIKIVSLTAALFEYVLIHGLVQFATTLGAVKDGIDAGWSAMRDIANIVIIGMFVFIAINIILGVKEFGDKKKVAQVLIIAVLINFSLLFTKGIIDASNFTAYQFYNSMRQAGLAAPSVAGAGTNPNLDATNPNANLTTAGISGKFLQMLGVSTLADSYDILRKAQDGNNSALLGLGYGLLSFIFLLAVAFVFLYGTYLIVTRAILLVLIMLTSALAFASWLIPHQYVEQGWMTWWKALLKTAFFAPIFIALLWVTTIIADRLVANPVFGTSGGSLGRLAVNATDPNNMLMVFNFVIIIGLLFASFKVSSMFSQSISGFGTVGTAVRGTAGAGVVAASRLAGIVGMNTLGWAGNRTRAAMRSYTYEPGKGRDKGLFGMVNKAVIRGANTMAKMPYDPLQAKPAQTIAKSLGGSVTKMFMDQTKDVTKHGFDATMKKKAEAADKLAREIGPSGPQLERIKADAEAASRDEHQNTMAQIQAERTALSQEREREVARMKEEVKASQPERATAEERKARAERGQSEVEARGATVTASHESDLRMMEQRIEGARRDANAKRLSDADIERVLAPLIDERNALLEKQHREKFDLKERERLQKQEIEAAQALVKGLDEAVEKQAKARADEVLRPRKVALDQREDEAESFRRRIRERAQDVANKYQQDFAKSLLWDPRAQGNISGVAKDRLRKERVRDIVDRDELRSEIRDAGGGGGGAAH